MRPHGRTVLVALAFTAAVTLLAYSLLLAQAPFVSASERHGRGVRPQRDGHGQHAARPHNVHAREHSGSARVGQHEWSVFNHRGAGWFIFFWGLTALIAGLQWPRRTWLRFVPPLTLLGLVEFLFLRNDPEAWPIGPVGFRASLKNPEVFQHRVFVLLLLVIAIVELLRAADRLPPLLQKFALPGLGLFGGIYLFFHKHGGSEMAQMMSDPAVASSPAMQSMMASMKLVKHEHLWFSTLGFGLAAAKLLADTGRLKGRLGATLWSVFAIMLGVYMMGYTE